jgi:serine/threonine-protein kinase
MNEQPPAQETIPFEELHEPLDAGLAAAFGPDSTPHGGIGLRAAPGQDTAPWPRIHLREPAADATPLAEPRSSDGLRPPHAFGRYQLSSEIGRGGAGVVLAGRDPDLGRDLAIKILLDAHVENPAMLRRFVEEAQIGGQLQHPGIVPVYELGRFGDRRPYFTMKMVKGRTLAALLEESTDPVRDRPRFLSIFEQVCQTMAYAHARGVVHRDLKPANVMVGAFGEVQIVDWGLAKVLASGGEANVEKVQPAAEEQTEVSTVRTAEPGSQTRVGSVLGTPAFMAPEQARGEADRLDERCDVFGLGAILCVILTGKPPFSGETSDQTRRQAEQGDLADAVARLDACGADADLANLANRCLAPEPNERPRNAGVVAEELTRYLASVQERLRSAELASAEARAKAAQERKARRHMLLIVILLMTTIFGSTSAWLWVKNVRDERRLQTARHVEDALQEASLLRGQAKATGNLPQWAEALAAARRAHVVLEAGEATPGLRRRVADLLADLEAEEGAAHRAADIAERDRRMVDRLATIRLRASDTMEDGHFSVARTDDAYTEAFRQYNLDVTALDVDQVAQRVHDSAIAPHLIAGLDEWAWCKAHRGDAEGTARCLIGAMRSDADPWRNRLRNPEVWLDKQKLEELAGQVEATEQPPSTLALFASALAESGATTTAVRVLTAAQQRRPDDFWLNHELAYYLCRLDPPRNDEAVGFYRAALAIRPDSPGVHNNLGILLAEQGKHAEAEAAYRRAIALQPSYFFAHNNLGNLLVRLERPVEAEAAYRDAIAVQPEYFEAYFHLAKLLESQGKLAEAVAAYEKAASLEPYKDDPEINSKAFSILGIALYEAGKFVGAVAALKKACELNPKDADLHSNLGLALSDSGDQPAAIAACKEAIHLRPDSAVAHKNLGLALQRNGDLYAAIESDQEAIRLRPEDSQAYSNLGCAYLKKGALDKAIAACEKARSIQPKNADAHFNLGLALAEKGQHADAVAAFREELALRKRPATYLHLAGSLEQLGKLEETEEAYRRLLELSPDDTQAHYNLGVILESLGKYAEAVDSYRQAIKRAPKMEVAHCNLGIALERQRKYADAADAFARAIELDPKDALAHYGLGRVLNAQGQYESALAAMRRAHKVGSADPNWTHPTARWVKMLERAVELDRKLAEIQKGEAKAASAMQRLQLAQFCQQQGKQFYSAAAQFYLNAFAEEPRSAESRDPPFRYQAACAAALAGCGRGQDAEALDEKARAHWRGQALDWLRADLTRWTKDLDSDKQEDRASARHALQNWLADADLAGIRDVDSLRRLPDGEQEAWRNLWAEVEALLKRPSEMK